MSRIAPSDEIALFLRVIDSGGFAAAAEHAGMTASGVSKVVSRLEGRLGVRLLHRTTRRLTITPEGETMLTRGRGILDAIEAMEAEIAATHGKPKGRVKLNVGTAYGKWCLLPTLTAFHRRFPDITIELGIDDRRVDVIGEQIDIAVRTGALDNSDLVARRLGMAERIICASREYVRRHGRPKAPADLMRHMFLRMTNAGPNAVWQMKARDGSVTEFDAAGWITSDSVDVMGEMVRAGMGLARLPSFMVRADLSAGRLVEVLAAHNAAVPFAVTALMPPGRLNLPRVRVLLEHLVQTLE